MRYHGLDDDHRAIGADGGLLQEIGRVDERRTKHLSLTHASNATRKHSNLAGSHNSAQKSRTFDS